MTRATVPQRRASEQIRYVCRGRSYIATVGYYDDGHPAEIFLVSGKAGTDADIAARDLGIAVSLALQHGCAVETLRHACLLDELSGRREGPLGMLLDVMANS